MVEYSVSARPDGEVGKSVRGTILPEVLDRYFSIWRNWPGGEAVTHRSAKPTFTGSIPVLASKISILSLARGVEKVVEILKKSYTA